MGWIRTGVRAVLPVAAAWAVLGADAAPVSAQQGIPGRVEVAWNRYHDHEGITRILQDIARAYPELVELRSIGKSLEGRDLWLAVVNSPASGSDLAKPAMWIDGNVHGNEIQGSEMVLYALWYLTKAYGVNEDLTKLLDRASFYLLPSVNPDGRSHWFQDSGLRGNVRPVDDDRDGVADEDPPEDVNGDGRISMMWQRDPRGRFRRSESDPRVFERVKPDEKGDWSWIGYEGIDNDGDGRVNEDGLGGDDMNRAWPSDWQPRYIQWGAGPYPLCTPETRSIAEFILAHPNIAAVQSYHNSGGMILRGPGASYRESVYPPEDVRVYDRIARVGEKLLPYYRYMVIYKDLYEVHGGFVNWTAEGLGIFSFTNELWTSGKFFQREGKRPEGEDMWLFRDRLQFGQVFVPYTEFDHPTYGKVLIGGLDKWASRVTPTFMLEEECHRNFGFTMYHAGRMPLLAGGRRKVAALPGGLRAVSTEFVNERAIPTRSGIQVRGRIGSRDRLVAETSGGVELVAAGTLGAWRDEQMKAVPYEPGRILVPKGIRGHGSALFRHLVRVSGPGTLRLRYEAERARDLEVRFDFQ